MPCPRRERRVCPGVGARRPDAASGAERGRAHPGGAAGAARAAARAARDGHPRQREEDGHVLVRLPVLQEPEAGRAQLHLRGRPALGGPAAEVDPPRRQPAVQQGVIEYHERHFLVRLTVNSPLLCDFVVAMWALDTNLATTTNSKTRDLSLVRSR